MFWLFRSFHWIMKIKQLNTCPFCSQELEKGIIRPQFNRYMLWHRNGDGNRFKRLFGWTKILKRGEYTAEFCPSCNHYFFSGDLNIDRKVDSIQDHDT